MKTKKKKKTFREQGEMVLEGVFIHILVVVEFYRCPLPYTQSSALIPTIATLTMHVARNKMAVEMLNTISNQSTLK